MRAAAMAARAPRTLAATVTAARNRIASLVTPKKAWRSSARNRAVANTANAAATSSTNSDRRARRALTIDISPLPRTELSACDLIEKVKGVAVPIRDSSDLRENGRSRGAHLLADPVEQLRG